MSVGGVGEVARFLPAVCEVAVCIEPGKVSRRGALYLVRLVRVGMARGGKVSRLFAAVGQIAGGVQSGEVARRRGGYLVGLACVGMICGGKIARLFAGVGRIAICIEPGKVARRRRGDFLRLVLVELFNVFLHSGLVCRREISGDNVARRPRAGGRAVLRSRDREHVPALGGHKHRFRRGAVRSNREQVRSLRQYGAVNDVYGRTRRRQRAGERSLRGVGLRRVHCH